MKTVWCDNCDEAVPLTQVNNNGYPEYITEWTHKGHYIEDGES